MGKNLVIIIVVILAIASTGVLWHVAHLGHEVRIRATTTTSLYATGLLDYLADEFRKEHPNVYIDFIPVGSGEALRRAANGDACIVLVHAPSLELKYMRQGVIVDGKIFAYNYFVIAGPRSDPANISSVASVVEAFKRIYYAGEEGRAKFVSRGDNSGTHVKELSIWKLAGLDPHGKPWYLETGSGMAETLLVANEEEGYVLTDIGTYLKLKKEGRLPNLVIVYSNDTELINIYSVYLVSTCSGEEREYAEKFIEFITSSRGQELIASYGVDKYGQQLFYPAIDKIDWLKSVWEELSRR